MVIHFRNFYFRFACFTFSGVLPNGLLWFAHMHQLYLHVCNVYLRRINAIVWYTVWINIDIRIEESGHTYFYASNHFNLARFCAKINFERNFMRKMPDDKFELQSHFISIIEEHMPVVCKSGWMISVIAIESNTRITFKLVSFFNYFSNSMQIFIRKTMFNFVIFLWTQRWFQFSMFSCFSAIVSLSIPIVVSLQFGCVQFCLSIKRSHTDIWPCCILLAQQMCIERLCLYF